MQRSYHGWVSYAASTRSPVSRRASMAGKEVYPMVAILRQASVGPWPMNTYAVICSATKHSAVVDPGADPDTILSLVEATQVEMILLTHAHRDHVGALAEIKAATAAPVYLHPADAEKFGVSYDRPLEDGDILRVGELRIRAVHTPGHTPGMVSFVIDHRVLVGDTLFVGGPGRTNSPEEFAVTMRTLQEIVFAWPDETEFYPGHGPSGVIGAERPAFEAFVARGWPPNLYGDVTWNEIVR